MAFILIREHLYLHSFASLRFTPLISIIYDGPYRYWLRCRQIVSRRYFSTRRRRLTLIMPTMFFHACRPYMTIFNIKTLFDAIMIYYELRFCASHVALKVHFEVNYILRFIKVRRTRRAHFRCRATQRRFSHVDTALCRQLRAPGFHRPTTGAAGH